ncbi:MAG TPA: tetratricopeptide repeat protein [Pirellulaceae bacterium]|jgi:tetratricopeptide (TPR) repeat protein
MSNVFRNLSAAVGLHNAGRFHEAEQIYRQIISEQPGQPDALHLLGLVAHQTGRSSEAIKFIQEALAVRPDFPDAHSNLGLVYKQQGQLELAIESFRHALESRPDSAEAHCNLGVTLLDNGDPQGAIEYLRRTVQLNPRLAEAWNSLGIAHGEFQNLAEERSSYEKALEINPNFASAHLNLGLALQKDGNIDDAIACFHRALNARPNFADAYFALGFALHKQGKLDDAIAAYRQAIAIQPNSVRALNNLATVLMDQGRPVEAIAALRRANDLLPNSAAILYSLGSALKADEQLEEAARCYRRAIELKPDFAEALNNLGTVLSAQESVAEAMSCFRRAIELRPTYGEAHHNLGNALTAQGLLDESGECYRQAIALMPNPATPLFSESGRKLLTGDLEHGWIEYESRWDTGQIPRRSIAIPRWEGERLEGRTILLHTEQGFGDTLQFIRFAAVIKNLGATVIVECQPQLVRLLASQPSIDRLIAEGDALPDCDFHAPLLSLPRILKTTLETIPAAVPYLFADPALVAHWRHHLKDFRGFRIGINWHGRAGTHTSRRRDIPLNLYQLLAQIPGVRFISIQKGAGQNELADASRYSAAARHQAEIADLGDFDTTHGAFMDTAAIMNNLDLIITSDTSIAHLAGALGLPTWTILPFAPDWRWLLRRSDTPWYPTMRLFRQKSLGDWEGAFSEIQNALRQLLSSR